MKKVNNIVLIAILSLLSGSALAQGGALCGTLDRELLIQVFANHTMTLVDPTTSQGPQVLAKFTQVDIRQTQDGTVFEASSWGAMIPNPNLTVGGARLGDLQWISLAINNSTANRGGSDDIVTGGLKIQKINGQIRQKLMSCTLNQAAFLRLP